MPSFKPFRGKGGLNLEIDFIGLAAAQAGLESLPITLGNGFKTALRNWADDVLQRSKPLVPVSPIRFKGPHLRDTGQVIGPEFKDGAWEVHIAYGDRKTAWYAAIVHERLDVRHPRGSAKYLEIPINENLKQLDSALASVIDSSLSSAMKGAA